MVKEPEEPVRLQTVISAQECRLFNEWCRRRGFMKRTGDANISGAMAFLIRQAIDGELQQRLLDSKESG